MNRTERGWIGHYICGHKCLFRRNTLLENDEFSIVISTVGYATEDGSPRTKTIPIGCYHYYETMVFHSNDTHWKDADISRQIYIPIKTQMRDIGQYSEIEANNMHESIVDLVSDIIDSGGVLETIGEEE